MRTKCLRMSAEPQSSTFTSCLKAEEQLVVSSDALHHSYSVHEGRSFKVAKGGSDENSKKYIAVAFVRSSTETRELLRRGDWIMSVGNPT